MCLLKIKINTRDYCELKVNIDTIHNVKSDCYKTI